MNAPPLELALDHGAISPPASSVVDANDTLHTALAKIANDACDVEIQNLCRSFSGLSDHTAAADLVPFLAGVCAHIRSRVRRFRFMQPGEQFEAYKATRATAAGATLTLKEFSDNLDRIVIDYNDAVETYLGGDEDLCEEFDDTFGSLQKKYMAAKDSLRLTI